MSWDQGKPTHTHTTSLETRDGKTREIVRTGAGIRISTIHTHTTSLKTRDGKPREIVRTGAGIRVSPHTHHHQPRDTGWKDKRNSENRSWDQDKHHPHTHTTSLETRDGKTREIVRTGAPIRVSTIHTHTHHQPRDKGWEDKRNSENRSWDQDKHHPHTHTTSLEIRDRKTREIVRTGAGIRISTIHTHTPPASRHGMGRQEK